jgi:hypothetical protein
VYLPAALVDDLAIHDVIRGSHDRLRDDSLPWLVTVCIQGYSGLLHRVAQDSVQDLLRCLHAHRSRSSGVVQDCTEELNRIHEGVGQNRMSPRESTALKFSHDSCRKEFRFGTTKAPSLVSASSVQEFLVIPIVQIDFTVKNGRAVSPDFSD